MKRFIILVIIMLVMCSFSSVAKINIYNQSSEKNDPLKMDDDVPTWQVGNYWTYEVDTLNLSLNESGQIFTINFTMNNLNLEVTSTVTDTYVLDVSGKIEGSFLYDDGAGKRLAGNLYFTSFSGNIVVHQSDLALKNGNLVLRSIALLREHPFLSTLPFPLPIPLTITFNLENNMPRPFIDFPLFDGKMGFIVESLISANIKVESIVLKILNIFIPTVPAELFFEQQINLPEIIYNATVENITVKAGMFSAYKIALYEGLLGSINYAPGVGNIIKTEAEMNLEDSLYFKFYGECKKYSFA